MGNNIYIHILNTPQKQFQTILIIWRDAYPVNEGKKQDVNWMWNIICISIKIFKEGKYMHLSSVSLGEVDYRWILISLYLSVPFENHTYIMVCTSLITFWGKRGVYSKFF